MSDLERINKTRGWEKWYGEEDLVARFRRVKAMLDADPELRERVREYLRV